MSFYQSLWVFQCSIGFLQPSDPLDDLEGTWQCESCLASVPSAFAEKVTDQVARTVNIMETAGAGVEQCERFLLVHSRYG